MRSEPLPASSSRDSRSRSGAISTTSRSAVGRSNPYTCVTTKPPMQCNHVGSVSTASSSLRKSCQSGSETLGEDMAQVIQSKVSEQVPAHGCFRTMRSLPAPFHLRHGCLTKSILLSESRHEELSKNVF